MLTIVCPVGAEVIPAATMHAFVHRFAPWGMRPTMISPAFGHLSQVGPEQVGALAQALADRIALMLGLTGAGMGVSVHDDILDLGLTSLTATAIIAQLRRERGKSVAIERWVEHPTCARLASLILDTPYVPATPAPTTPALSPPRTSSTIPGVIEPVAPKVHAAAATPPAAINLNVPPLVTELAAQPLRKHNRTQGWLWRRLVSVGPHIERWNDLALPYGLGTQMQRVWLSQRWVQKRYFDTEIALLSEWLTRVGRSLDQEIVLQNLMINCWPHWRRRAFQRDAVSARYFQVHGAIPLQEARSDRRGTVFAITHTPGRWMVLDWLIRQDQPTAWITYSSQMQQAYKNAIVSQIYQAGEVLQQGGNVLITTDGWHGEDGALVDLGHGVRRELYPGAAELAARNDARLVPVEVRMGLDGVMKVEIKAALQPLLLEGNSGREQSEKNAVDALHAAYVAYYRQQWPTELEYQSWNTLHTGNVRLQQLSSIPQT